MNLARLENSMKKMWIAGAIKHPGALHKELHVPAGEKIPKKKLEKAAEKPGKEGKRARLAETLESLHNKGKVMAKEKKDAKVDHKKMMKMHEEKMKHHEKMLKAEQKAGVKGDKKLAKEVKAGKKELKVKKVMHEFKEGQLHSGSKKGPEVSNPKQAIAIALSESRKVGKKSKK